MPLAMAVLTEPGDIFRALTSAQTARHYMMRLKPVEQERALTVSAVGVGMLSSQLFPKLSQVAFSLRRLPAASLHPRSGRPGR